jgi:hypothetical protein
LEKKQWRSDKPSVMREKIVILKQIIKEFIYLAVKTLDKNVIEVPDLKRKVDLQLDSLHVFLESNQEDFE